ncbi:MAG TPA: DUF3566 domain-containing protein [Terriglobales bacterium]|jgi:hypothetical protein|nr:DUF3566 domain-containing protein [Terriglobales bacterium]
MTKIRTVRVFSAAKVNALLYGILGLLIAPFLMLGPGLAMMGGEKRSGGFGGVIAVAAIAPIFYGLIGFVAGAIMAFIYNAISHSVGGIEVELDFPPSPITTVPSLPVSAPPIAASSEPAPPVRPEFE